MSRKHKGYFEIIIYDDFTKISFLKLYRYSLVFSLSVSYNKKLFQAVLRSVNQIEDHFRSVTDMSRSTETPKGIQVPGFISFKNSLKEAWRMASSIFKMAVKFSYEKYTCSGENSSRTLSVCVSNNVNHTDKDEKFSGNSSIFKWKNRKISNSKRAKYYNYGH